VQVGWNDERLFCDQQAAGQASQYFGHLSIDDVGESEKDQDQDQQYERQTSDWSMPISRVAEHYRTRKPPIVKATTRNATAYRKNRGS